MFQEGPFIIEKNYRKQNTPKQRNKRFIAPLLI